MLDISVSLSLTGISLFSHSKIVPDSAPPDDLTRMNVFDVVGRLVVAIALIHKPRVGSALNAVRRMKNILLTAPTECGGNLEQEKIHPVKDRLMKVQRKF